MYGGTHRKFGLLGCLLVYGGTYNQVWVTGLFTDAWRNSQGSVGDWAVYWCMEEPTGSVGDWAVYRCMEEPTGKCE